MSSVPGNTRQACAYDRGRQARRLGRLITDNPHKPSHLVDHQWWIKGWNEGAEQ